MSRFGESARWLAVAAVAGLLFWQSTGITLETAFLWSLVFCLGFTAAVVAAMLWLAPDGWRHILRHPDLLVPLGLLAAALGLVDWICGWQIGLQTPLFAFSLGVLPVAVSVAWVLRILLHTLFATWMTLLVVDVVRQDRLDLGGALPRSKRRFLRVLVLLCLGWGSTTLLYAVEIPLLLMLVGAIAHVLGRAGEVAVWSLLIGALAFRFLISLATAAVLPVAVESRQGFWATLRRGIAVSWQNRGQWWGLLLLQYVLAGAYATGHYVYLHSGWPGSSSTKFNFNFRYSGPWLADYQYASQPYSQVMGWLSQQPLATVATLAALLTGLLSIVVKLAIVQRYSAAELLDQQPPDFAPVATIRA
ncbi:MAG: hypothetical protein JXB62_22960 [Pirellulales bacterium]|nr:hypothetical protein [Pirellulales bacterium]